MKNWLTNIAWVSAGLFLASAFVAVAAEPNVAIDRRTVEDLAKENINQNLDDFILKLTLKSISLGDLNDVIAEQPISDFTDIFGSKVWQDEPSLEQFSTGFEIDQFQDSEYAQAASDAAKAELARQRAEIDKYTEHLSNLKKQMKTSSVEEIVIGLKNSYVPQEVAAIIAPDPIKMIAIPPVEAGGDNGLIGFITFSNNEAAFSSDFPQVAMMVSLPSQQTPASSGSLCTATLVAPNVLVTAAHCLCGLGALNGATCHADLFETIDSQLVFKNINDLRVFLPLDGLAELASVAVPEEYKFSVTHDIAILKLASPAQYTPPMALDFASPVSENSSARIVGYGYHNVVDENGATVSPTLLHLSGISLRAGLKLVGNISTSKCDSNASPGASDNNLICWRYGGEGGGGAGTCQGDSGGPMLLFASTDPTLVGITSGGRKRCQPDQMPFSTRLSSTKEWVLANIGGAQNTSTTANEVRSFVPLLQKNYGQLSILPENNRFNFDVTGDAEEIIASLSSNFNASVFMNIFDPSGNLACTSELKANFQYCKIRSPKEGKWVLELVGAQAVEFQLLVARPTH